MSSSTAPNPSDRVMPRVIGIVNTDSGSAAPPAEVEAMLTQVAQHRGWALTFEAATKETIGATVKRAVDARPHAIIIGGGDGTIRSLISLLVGTETVVGILPMGTMNFVAKDLGLPTDVPGALASLANARTIQIDVGEVNGRHFLHSSTLGIVPRLTVERERVRSAASISDRARAALHGLLTAYGASRVTLDLEHDGTKATHRTFSIIVANNELSSDPLTPYRRPTLDGGALHAYVANHRGRIGLARLLATMGSGWWYWDRNVSTVTSPVMTIRSRKHLVPVTNDGELDLIPSPLRYRSLPRAVRVFAPAAVAPPKA